MELASIRKGIEMTRLFVDEREVPFPPPGVESLEQVLKHVQDTHLSREYVIRQVSVDGLPILTDQVQGSIPGYDGNISSRGTIEVITGAVCEIASDSIQEAISYLERVEAVTPSIATSFQISPGPEAFEHLRQLYEGFYWLNLLLDRLNSFYNVNAETNQVNGKPIREHQDRFLSNLKQMVEAHEKGDYILMADLLEFEIVPLIPDLKQLFVDLSRRSERAQ
jgi:hypothetical protein